jgi:hypothetical protein
MNKRRKLKYFEKTLLQSHSVHHKSHMDCPRIEARLPYEKPMSMCLFLALESKAIQNTVAWKIQEIMH